MNWLLVICLVIQTYLSYVLCKKNILAASVISSTMFLLSAIVYASFSSYFLHDISINTVIVILSSIAVMTIAEASSYRVSIKGIFNRYKVDFINGNEYQDIPIIIYRYKVIAISIVGCILAAISYYELYKFSLLHGNPGNILSTITFTRNAVVESEHTGLALKLVAYIGIFIQAVSLWFLFLYLYNRLLCGIKYNYYLMPLIAHSFLLLSSTERIGYLRLAAIIVIMTAVLIKASNRWKRNEDKRIIKYAITGIIVFIILFIGLGLLSERVIKDNLINYVASYLGSSIYGIDYYLQSPWGNNRLFGQNTLYNIYYNLKIIGFNLPVKKTFLPFFYWQNGASNVYTSLVSPIEDFGVFGLLVTRFILGFLYGQLFRHIRNIKNYRNKAFALIVYSLFMYPVMLSSIADSYMFFLQLPNIYLFISLYIVKKLMKSKEKRILAEGNKVCRR